MSGKFRDGALDVGCTWNCEIRNNGTATYCLPALKSIPGVTVKHYQPRGEVGKHDFYLYVDDGRDDLNWLPPHPRAYWAGDTHLGYGYRLWKARQFDKVFVAQKEAVSQFEHDGIKNVTWLPHACEPLAHKSGPELANAGVPVEDLAKRHDIAFCGFLNEANGDLMNNRVEWLDHVFKEFKNSWLSTNVFFEQMALRYIRARIGFNISIRRDLNMRVFEVMSIGTPLLTNRNVEGITDLFEEDVDYFGYETKEEAVSKAHAVLGNPEQAEKVAANAIAKARSAHTYRHRMEVVLEEMKHV